MGENGRPWEQKSVSAAAERGRRLSAGRGSKTSRGAGFGSSVTPGKSSGSPKTESKYSLSFLPEIAQLPLATFYYHLNRVQKTDKYAGAKGILQSMSHKVRCLNNAAVKNFFALFKSKLIYLQEFQSIEHFKQEFIDYLNYHDNKRIKANRKGLPPTIHRQ